MADALGAVPFIVLSAESLRRNAFDIARLTKRTFYGSGISLLQKKSMQDGCGRIQD